MGKVFELEKNGQKYNARYTYLTDDPDVAKNYDQVVLMEGKYFIENLTCTSKQVDNPGKMPMPSNMTEASREQALGALKSSLSKESDESGYRSGLLMHFMKDEVNGLIKKLKGPWYKRLWRAYLKAWRSKGND